jgi:hypothetical protein
MNQRIQQFEPIWERIRIRLSSGVDTSDEMTREILSLVPPPLERQTNHLWTLSEEDREQWFNATSPEERDAILAIPPFVSILDEPPHLDEQPTLEPPPNRADFLTEANQIRYWAARTKQERDLIMAEEGFDPDM